MCRCHVCNEPLSGDSFTLKEQYFGTGEEFLYTQCSNCRCIQILDIPPNLGKYYPAHYYSKKVKKYYRNNKFLSLLRSLRLDSTLHNSPLRHILTLPNLPRWATLTDLNSKSRILDVGCGSGQRLLNLRKKGFIHLEGVEPFIEKDICYTNGVLIHHCELSSLASRCDKQGYFDLVMMHHSLEHIPDQNLTMKSAHKLLSNHGKLLIRIPICSSYAWEHYRQNWV
jgi:2-polyprenyl-3-methyl-5-hydroxy-6-metoxy-1,4-benzoquinol methylase